MSALQSRKLDEYWPQAQQALTDLGRSAAGDPAVSALIAREYPGNGPLHHIFVNHSYAVMVAALCLGEGFPIDREFVTEASWLHDIGINKVNAPQIHCLGDEPYLRHGIIGRKMCDQMGLSEHGLVCERHVGTGLSAQEIRTQSLPLPLRDMLCETLEQRLVCYADQFFSKSGLFPLSLQEARSRAARHGESPLARFDSFVQEFGPLPPLSFAP